MKRFIYALGIFAALGPPIGGVVFGISTALLGAVTGTVRDSAMNAVLFIVYSAVLSYLVAFAPAAFAGFLYALTPVRWRGGPAAGVFGAASALAAMLIQRPGMLSQFVFSGSYVLAGAVAALVCGALADFTSRAPPAAQA